MLKFKTSKYWNCYIPYNFIKFFRNLLQFRWHSFFSTHNYSRCGCIMQVRGAKWDGLARAFFRGKVHNIFFALSFFPRILPSAWLAPLTEAKRQLWQQNKNKKFKMTRIPHLLRVRLWWHANVSKIIKIYLSVMKK